MYHHRQYITNINVTLKFKRTRIVRNNKIIIINKQNEI